MRLTLPCRWKLWIIAILLPLLAGCSALRMTYGQGPFLAYWWLDGYAEFTAEQSPRVKAALDDWFAWHRATQLPDYAAWLAGLRRQAVDNITPQQTCAMLDDVQRRLERGFEQAVPAMAEIVRTMTQAQIDHLERRYARSNEELARDYLQPVPAERFEASVKRSIARIESFYGDLDEAQQRLLREGLKASPFNPQVWLDERRQRQQDIVRSLRRLLAERADAATVQAALRSFSVQATQSPRAEFRAYQRRLNQDNCALTARLHNAMSAAQRQQLASNLKGWEDDLRALMKP
jgi:hypothetical protein